MYTEIYARHVYVWRRIYMKQKLEPRSFSALLMRNLRLLRLSLCKWRHVTPDGLMRISISRRDIFVADARKMNGAAPHASLYVYLARSRLPCIIKGFTRSRINAWTPYVNRAYSRILDCSNFVSYKKNSEPAKAATQGPRFQTSATNMFIVINAARQTLNRGDPIRVSHANLWIPREIDILSW